MKLKDFDFRTWHYKEKQFVRNFESLFTQGDCEVELWSGFYDKGGKKIYEGDIVEFRGEQFIVKFNKGLKLSVISINGEHEYAMHTSKSNFRACKVVGNIHENKELIR